MNIVEPGFEILTPLDEIKSFPKRIERAGRVCYRSEDRIGAETDEKFCRMIIRRGHESVLEHCSATVLITCDRSTSHQLVRHRLAAYSQESQRYVKYDNLEVILPRSISSLANGTPLVWREHIEDTAKLYKLMLDQKVPPEDARSVLPNATATRVVSTFNIRQWRHVFDMRVDHHAQWQIRDIFTGILKEFHTLAPCLFEDKMKKFELETEQTTTVSISNTPMIKSQTPSPWRSG